MPKADFAAGAATFDEQRGFPEDVGAELRAIVLARVPGGGGARLLETGVGTGRVAAPFLAAGCRYVGVDSSPQMLARCRARFGDTGGRLALVLGDMTRLPFAAGAFDAVLAASVYRVVAPWQAAALETSRVLARPGVLFLIQHEVAPDSLEDILSEQKRQILARLGVGAYLEGGAGDADVARFFAAQGATVETVRTGNWTSLRTPRACIARFLRGSRVADRPWSDPLARELEGFAVAHYGSLDAEEAVARTLRVYAIRL